MPSPSDVPTRKYLSWRDVDNAVGRILQQVRGADYNPTHIVGIGRGGIIPASMFLYQYCLSSGCSPMIAPIYARSYEGEGETQRGELQIAVNDLDLFQRAGGDVLIVDDITDSGNTFSAIKELLPEAHTASIIHKTCSTFEPDYHGPVEPNGEKFWYVFPWERTPIIG